MLIFYEDQYDNQIHVNTAPLPAGSSLKELCMSDFAYDNRYFKKDYAPMRIAGKPACGFVNRYVQAYSGVTIFFEHGGYYTLVHIKIITRAGLDVNWQIVRSLQSPGSTPVDNLIPQELIDDSYKLL